MSSAELFSIVINTTDRAGPLRTLLRTLEHQSYPWFEVIVVVGPTRDDTMQVLAEYEGRVRVLQCAQANLGRSRNAGLMAACGSVVAFVDDDAVPCRCWLEQLARLFRDPGLAATGGEVYLVHPRQPAIQHRLGIVSSLAEQQDVCTSWIDPVPLPGEGRQWVRRMMGTNMAFRREALIDIGGFDEFFEWVFDDADVAMRLVNAGYRVWPVREAIVYHVPASSRNRVAYTYHVKWWFQTKAAIYMAIKNGLAAGDPRRAIIRRSVYLLHGHWKWSGELWRAGQLTFAQFVSMRANEVASGVSAFYHGFFRRRKLLRVASDQEPGGPEPIRPFHAAQAHPQAAVDPVAGSTPTLSVSDPSLRLCLLSSAYPPHHYDGIGRLTHLMARGLFERGHTVHVVTRGEVDRITFRDGAYVHEVAYRLDRYQQYRDWPRLYHLLNYSHAVHDKVRRLILNDGVQVVDSPLWQFDGLVTAVSGVLPVVVRLVTAARQIAALQGERDGDSRLLGEMERVLLDRAVHLLPNTLVTLDTAVRVYGLQAVEERCTVIPYGIVPVADDLVQPFDLERQDQERTVLYVGRLEKRKGVRELFEAIPRVLEQVPAARFIVAGADNSQHDGFRAQTGLDYPTYFCQRYRNVVSRVEFKGFMDEETLQGLYRTCDLFVAPSLFESFGLIYLEAMNYGKPVIGCRSGGVPEVVEDGVTGVLVEPADPNALARAITTLLTSPRRLHEMGLAGRERLVEYFSYERMARDFEAAYRHVVARAPVREGKQ
ncbi:MAG: glycosyltransferase [Anaerolineae bacterium]|nr:glycosyltransferase [Anaerolineae bacterium]